VQLGPRPDPTEALPARPEQKQQPKTQHQTPHAEVKGRLAHHLRIPSRPVTLAREQANGGPLPTRRQVAVLGLAIPPGRPLGQSEFGPAPPGLLLLAREPLP